MVDPLVWLVFGAAIVAMLAVDLVVAGRSSGPVPSLRAAAWWSAGWTAVALAFAAVVLAWRGERAASEYLTGFVLERSLSLDNLFVFAMLFGYLAVPEIAQRKVLFYGIVGAIVLRLVFILAGGALLDAVHWSIYLFGALLVATGARMALHGDEQIHPERNPVLRAVRRTVPSTSEYHGDRIAVRIGGRRLATPLLAALALVATFDVVFAVDSIPAIFAVTRDTFTVFAANAFSLLGMVSLFFVLDGLLDRFRHLHLGLAAILLYVAAKMLLADVWHPPLALSLAVIVGALAVAMATSAIAERRERERASPAGS
jgi:tellurite resistance protein TerC